MKPGVSLLRPIPALLLIFGSLLVRGATLTVSNLDDSGPGSLRDTLAAAGSGDTINFSVTGTILLTSGELNNQGKNLSIMGPGYEFLTVRQNSIPGFRIFKLDGTVTIFGITIADGSVRSGPTCSQPCHGGGVYNAGNLTMTACVISGNRANLDGGGIQNDGTLTLVDCTLTGNRAGDGTSFAFGGALWNQGNATVRRCLFQANHADTSGAAIYTSSSLTLENSTLYDNSNGSSAIHIYLGGSATITSCTFSRNRGRAGCGAAICNVGTLTLRNTILDNNTPTNIYSSANFTSQGYNLSTDGAYGLLSGTADQINVDPGFDSYGLRYNGGYTKTIALAPGSPAIDKGKSFGLTNDGRGHPRPVDNPFISSAAGGDNSDIGAYESPTDPIQSSTNLIVTTSDDHDDGICGALDCTLREAIQRANTLPGANLIILDGSLQPTISLKTRTLSELVVSDSTTIVGPGARVLALSSDGYNRVFTFLGGANTISALTIRDGIKADSSGAGGTALGGGIYNQATLTINDCTIAENRVLGGSAGSPGANGGTGAGGGIFNVGTLTLNRCAFVHNGVFGGSGAASPSQFGIGGTGGAAKGSAIFSSGTATFVNNCTFFNNVANGGAGANGGFLGGNGGSAEGTVYNESTLSVTASTFSGNNGFGGTRGLGNSIANHGVNGAGRGGLFNAAGNSTVRNVICASNVVSGFAVSVDAHGAFISGGYNLIGSADNSTGFTDPTDQTGTYNASLNPVLGPMQDNGGPTDTMALRYGSPAIDKGKNFGLASDQRGATRLVDTSFANAVGGDGTDIGAVEMNLLGGPDSDGDGMSDDFENFFGVNDPNADPDGDGQTNLQEFNNGTNPIVAELLITTVTVNGTNVTVTFRIAINGNSYRLERKNNLNDAWGPIPGLADFSATSTGSAQITDPGGATAARHFYRIRRLP